ncbi:MAG: protein TolQ [Pseudomonadota bacterium]
MEITTLILRSDILIKTVMIFLLAFSVISWAIFLSKYFFLKKSEKESEDFYNKFLASGDMDKSYSDAKRYENGYLPAVYIAGYDELKELCKNTLEKESLDSVQRAMSAKTDMIAHALNVKVPFLATIGSSSPFIGLLGTVWGIINAFRGLAIAQNNTISAVAPGIAEALITTAVGLLTAIPAVIFYNHVANKIDKLQQRSNSFIYEFINTTYRVFLQPEKSGGKGKGEKKLNGNKKNLQENVQ